MTVPDCHFHGFTCLFVTPGNLVSIGGSAWVFTNRSFAPQITEVPDSVSLAPVVKNFVRNIRDSIQSLTRGDVSTWQRCRSCLFVRRVWRCLGSRRRTTTGTWYLGIYRIQLQALGEVCHSLLLGTTARFQITSSQGNPEIKDEIGFTGRETLLTHNSSKYVRLCYTGT